MLASIGLSQEQREVWYYCQDHTYAECTAKFGIQPRQICNALRRTALGMN